MTSISQRGHQRVHQRAHQGSHRRVTLYFPDDCKIVKNTGLRLFCPFILITLSQRYFRVCPSIIVEHRVFQTNSLKGGHVVPWTFLFSVSLSQKMTFNLTVFMIKVQLERMKRLKENDIFVSWTFLTYLSCLRNCKIKNAKVNEIGPVCSPEKGGGCLLDYVITSFWV